MALSPYFNDRLLRAGNRESKGDLASPFEQGVAQTEDDARRRDINRKGLGAILCTLPRKKEFITILCGASG